MLVMFLIVLRTQERQCGCDLSTDIQKGIHRKLAGEYHEGIPFQPRRSHWFARYSQEHQVCRYETWNVYHVRFTTQWEIEYRTWQSKNNSTTARFGLYKLNCSAHALSRSGALLSCGIIASPYNMANANNMPYTLQRAACSGITERWPYQIDRTAQISPTCQRHCIKRWPRK